MKKIKIILLAIFLLFFTSSCSKNNGSIDINEGAVVKLKINTDAKDFDVSSSLGTVLQKDKFIYEITTDCKKDFTITVSSKGYATNNVRIYSKELNTSILNKEINLVEKTKLNLSLEFLNSDEEIDIINDKGNKIATSKNSKIDLAISKDDLDKPLVFSNKSIEPYTYKLSESKKGFNYVDERIIVANKDTKMIKVNGNGQFYAINDNEEFVKVKYVTIREGWQSTSLRFIELDKDYVGKITFKSINHNNKDVIFDINQETPVYGSEYNIDQDKWIESVPVSFINNDLEEYKFYFEQEGKINELYVEHGENGEFSYIPKNINKIYAINLEDLNLEQYILTIESKKIDFANKELLGYQIPYYMYHDIVGEEFNGKVTLYDENYFKHEEIVVKDGLFVVPFKGRLEYNGEYISLDYLNNLVLKDNKLAALVGTYPISFKNQIKTYYDNKMIEFDYIKYNEQLEHDPVYNIYSSTINDNYFYKNIIGVKGNEYYFGSLDDNFIEMKKDINKYNEVTHTFMQNVNFKKNGGFLFRFEQEYKEGQYSQITNVKILDEGCKTNKIADSLYYVNLLDINNKLHFEVTTVTESYNEHMNTSVENKLNLEFSVQDYFRREGKNYDDTFNVVFDSNGNIKYN